MPCVEDLVDPPLVCAAAVETACDAVPLDGMSAVLARHELTRRGQSTLRHAVSCMSGLPMTAPHREQVRPRVM